MGKKKHELLDPYQRPLVAMWIQGVDLSWLRKMALSAVSWFDQRFEGQTIDNLGTADQPFEVEVTSVKYPAKRGQPVDLYGIKLYARKYGYHVSVVEPNPAKARNIQVYCKKAMNQKNNSYWQEIFHFTYHPNTAVPGKGKFVQLMYLPDCSGGSSRDAE